MAAGMSRGPGRPDVNKGAAGRPTVTEGAAGRLADAAPVPASAVVELVGVRFSYGAGATSVLSGVDLTLRAGELFVLVGANGAGKSTIVKLVLGELVPQGGSVRLFGVAPGSRLAASGGAGARRDAMAGMGGAGLAAVGYVLQRIPAAYDHFPATVAEVVGASVIRRGACLSADPARLGGVCPSCPEGRQPVGVARCLTGRQVRERVGEALRLTGVEDLAGRMIGRLSGGQLQRVMLARALVNAPRLLVLDEPTTGLDEASVAAFYRTVERERSERGVAVLLVTHDLANATRLANGRVRELRQGVLVVPALGCACEPASNPGLVREPTPASDAALGQAPAPACAPAANLPSQLAADARGGRPCSL